MEEGGRGIGSVGSNGGRSDGSVGGVGMLTSYWLYCEGVTERWERWC